jgi:Arginase family
MRANHVHCHTYTHARSFSRSALIVTLFLVISLTTVSDCVGLGVRQMHAIAAHEGASGVTQSVGVIGVPIDMGAGRRGVDMGPSALRLAKINTRITELGYQVIDHGNIAVTQKEEQNVSDESARYWPIIEPVWRLRSVSSLRGCADQSVGPCVGLSMWWLFTECVCSVLGGLFLPCVAHATLGGERPCQQDRTDLHRRSVSTHPRW